MRHLTTTCRAAGIALLATCLALSLASEGRADTIWQTVAVDNSWNTAGNWTAGVPDAADVAFFTSSSITTLYHNGDKSVAGLNYSGGSDFVQNGGGGVIYVYDSGITVNGGTQTFNAQVRSRGNVMPVVNNGAGLLDFNGDFYIHRPAAGTTAVTFSGDGDFEVKQFVRRTTNYNMDLTKEGAGTLTIQQAYPNPGDGGTSGYITGPTTINGGTIVLGAAAALGTGPVTLNAGGTLNAAGTNPANDITFNGGTLWVANGASGTLTLNNVAGNTINASGNYRLLSGQITGAGGFTIGGTTTPGIALSNPANDFQGDIVISPGAYLRLNADEVIPDTASLSGGGQLRLEGDGRTETIAGLNTSNRVFAVNGGGGATLRVGAGGATSAHSGQIGGGGANNQNITLEKIGAGTLTLSGNSDYTGGTLVDGGTLRAGHVNAFGVGPATVNAGATLDAAGYNIANDVTLNGGTLYMTNATSGTITLNGVPGNQIFATGNYRVVYGQITGAGGFTVGGINTPGVALANPANDFLGDVSINGGSYLRLNASEVIPDTADVTSNGYLRFEGSGRTETIGGLNGGGQMFAIGGNATLRVGANDASGSYSGTTGASWDPNVRDIEIVKIGNSVQSLSGILYHTGGTTVEDGTLRLNRTSVGFPGLGATGQFASAQTVMVNSGATLQVNGNWVMGDGLQNKVVVNGGTLEFLNSDNYMGNIELTGGAVTTSGGTRPWRTGNWGNGVITVNGSGASSTIDGSLCFVGTAAAPQTIFNVADGAAADDLVVSARIYDHPGFERDMILVKNGAGKMVLSNDANTFAGGVTINDGTLSVTSLNSGNDPCALGATYGTAPWFIFDGGTLEYTGGTVGGINRAFTINPGGATIDIANAATTVTWTDGAGAGPIIGTGLFTKAGDGTLVFTGSNSHTGGSVVEAGTLRTTNVNGLGTGGVTVNSGALLDLANVNVANDITLNGGVLWTANGASGTITLNDVPGNKINANGHYRILSGQITGAGGLAIGGINTPGIQFANPANDFQGDVTVDPGAYLRLTVSEVIPDTATVTVNGNLRLEGGGHTETIAGLTGTGAVWIPLGSANHTLRVGAYDTSSTFSGSLVPPGQTTSLSLVKIGAGTLTLNSTGTNRMAGGVTVDGGMLSLAVNRGFNQGYFQNLNNLVYTVNSGATLRANGDWVLRDNSTVNLNGGTLEFLNSDSYLCNVEMTGGAITTSGGIRPWRTGNWSNGLITVNPSAASSTIDGSLCFVGTAAAPTTTFDVADGAAADDLVVSAAIYDHPGFEGRMTLVKAGAGTMVLSGASSYTGGTTVSQGTLQLGNGGSTGSIVGPVTLGDANTGASDVAFLVNRSDNNTHANPIVVSALGTGTATIGSSSTAGGPLPTIFSGTVALNRPTTMQGTDPDRTTYTNLISGNVGILTVNGGARTTWEADNSFVGDVDIQGAGTILQVGSGSGATTQQIPNASNVNIGTGARLHLVFDDEAINGLTGTGTVAFYPGGGLGATTLTVGAGGANAAFGGTIENGSGTAMNLVKAGAGTQALDGNSTYTGTTTVAGGTLILNGTHTGGGAYTVAPGATLAGDGVATAAVTIQGGGVLAPDGDLATGALDLMAGATLAIDLNALAMFDQVLVTGGVGVGGARLALGLGYAPENGDSFIIVDNDTAADAVNGFFAGLEGNGARINASFGGEEYGFWVYYDHNGNDIALVAVPEPATLTLLGLGGLAALIRRRRKS